MYKTEVDGNGQTYNHSWRDFNTPISGIIGQWTKKSVERYI